MTRSLPSSGTRRWGSERPAAGAFTFSLPTTVRFGPGVRDRAGEEVARFGRRFALFTGRSLERNPARPALEASLESAGLSRALTVFADGEPDDNAVASAAARLRAEGVDAVVAVGGGSVLDLAKASALVASDETRLRRHLQGERVAEPAGPPVVAMPTTAGSGAEVSHGAIVLDRIAGRKRGIRGPGIAARVALVDPELSMSGDPGLTALAGFDALSHAVETSVSRVAGPLVHQLSADALPRLLEHVPGAMADGRNLTARSETAYAALAMGVNLANSTTCLPHRLQYPVGALTGTAHAAGIAAIFPPWLERTRAVAPDRLARLARLAGLAPPARDDGEAADALVAAVLAFLEAVGLRLRLRDLGVARGDLRALVGATEGTLANDPGPVEPDDLLALYEASL